jgi:hypothetical protein
MLFVGRNCFCLQAVLEPLLPDLGSVLIEAGATAESDGLLQGEVFGKVSKRPMEGTRKSSRKKIRRQPHLPLDAGHVHNPTMRMVFSVAQEEPIFHQYVAPHTMVQQWVAGTGGPSPAMGRWLLNLRQSYFLNTAPDGACWGTAACQAVLSWRGHVICPADFGREGDPSVKQLCGDVLREIQGAIADNFTTQSLRIQERLPLYIDALSPLYAQGPGIDGSLWLSDDDLSFALRALSIPFGGGVLRTRLARPQGGAALSLPYMTGRLQRWLTCPRSQ